MATLFRALVMLAVLVGLPMAWIYYGPLPPEAQPVVDRFLAVAKEAIGWRESGAAAARPEFEYLAPGDPRLLRKERSDDQPPTPAVNGLSSADPPAPVPISTLPPAPPEAAAAQPAPLQAAMPAAPLAGEGPSIAEQVEPFLRQLRQLGVVEYVLQRWGDGGLYRFSCEMPLVASPQLTQQFEAVTPDPAQCVEEVVAQIAAWRLAQRETIVQ